MTRAFYEQLGAPRDAEVEQLRSAYTRVITQLIRRRKGIVEQGGDPSRIDLDRAQLEEAWEVLSDPVRRRKYDAMLEVMESEERVQEEGLWERVESAFVDPAAAAVTQLLDQTTRLGLGRLEARAVPQPPPQPLSEPPDPTLIPHPEDEGKRAEAESVDWEDDVPSEVVQLPSAAKEDPNPSFRVVDGRGKGSPIIMLPHQEPSRPALAAETVRGLVESHGYSGTMLKAVREEMHMTLEQLGTATNISEGYLEAIESNAFDRLPAATFVRGYVRVLASTLGLDEQAVVTGYMKNYSV